MTEIYVIRHAQSEGNLFRMMQGQWDGNITALGHRQIASLAERFRDVHLDAVYSSDLTRTRLTAGAILKYHDLPLHTTKALREMNLGRWEGCFFGDLAFSERDKLLQFITDMQSWELDGAETSPMVAERTYKELVNIAEENDGKTVAVVSHGLAIRCMLWYCLNADLRDTERNPITTNTGVTHLFYENGKFTCDYINDNSHLSGIDSPIWGKTADLRGESFDPASDPAFYKSCYESAWMAAHGSTAGFSPMTYYVSALDHYHADHGAVIRILDEDKAVGLIDLDTQRGAHAGYGWISLLVLQEDYRHRGCGIQLLARAMKHYEALGRRAIRLHVAEDNRDALAFYERWGFRVIGGESTARGQLLLMEKKFGENGYV